MLRPSLITLAVSSLFLQACQQSNQRTKSVSSPTTAQLLDFYDSCDALQKDVHEILEERRAFIEKNGGVVSSVGSDAAEASNKANETSNNSKTSEVLVESNKIEESVEESDLIKMNTSLIFQLHQDARKVLVTKRSDLSDAGELTIDLPQSYQLSTLVVTEQRLVVMAKTPGSQVCDRFGYVTPTLFERFSNWIIPTAYAEPAMDPCWTDPSLADTLIYIFDLDKESSPKLAREIRVKGGHSKVRLVNGKDLVFYSTSRLNLDQSLRNGAFFSHKISIPEKPITMDEAVGISKEGLGCNRIVRMNTRDSDFSMTRIVHVDIENHETPTEQVGVIGTANEIYVTDHSIYLVKPDIRFDRESKIGFAPSKVGPSITRIAFSKDQKPFLRPSAHFDQQHLGVIPNAFSIKEYVRQAEVYLAFFLTENNNTNHLHILKQERDTLKTVASVQDFGKTEDIRSARFLDNWAYVVTYKKTDPLFAFNLTDLHNPVLTSELKIPGFSTYLHPLTENALLGFGFDADESDPNQSFFTGLKMSVFDISDPLDVKEVYTKIMGDRGSYSDLITDHRALWIDHERQIFGVPMTLLKDETAELPVEVPTIQEDLNPCSDGKTFVGGRGRCLEVVSDQDVLEKHKEACSLSGARWVSLGGIPQCSIDQKTGTYSSSILENFSQLCSKGHLWVKDSVLSGLSCLKKREAQIRNTCPKGYQKINEQTCRRSTSLMNSWRGSKEVLFSGMKLMDFSNPFELREISSLSHQDLDQQCSSQRSQGQFWSSTVRQPDINRAFHVGDILYSISRFGIQAHSLNDLSQLIHQRTLDKETYHCGITSLQNGM